MPQEKPWCCSWSPTKSRSMDKQRKRNATQRSYNNSSNSSTFKIDLARWDEPGAKKSVCSISAFSWTLWSTEIPDCQTKNICLYISYAGPNLWYSKPISKPIAMQAATRRNAVQIKAVRRRRLWAETNNKWVACTSLNDTWPSFKSEFIIEFEFLMQNCCLNLEFENRADTSGVQQKSNVCWVEMIFSFIVQIILVKENKWLVCLSQFYCTIRQRLRQKWSEKNSTKQTNTRLTQSVLEHCLLCVAKKKSIFFGFIVKRVHDANGKEKEHHKQKSGPQKQMKSVRSSRTFY